MMISFLKKSRPLTLLIIGSVATILFGSYGVLNHVQQTRILLLQNEITDRNGNIVGNNKTVLVHNKILQVAPLPKQTVSKIRIIKRQILYF